MGMSSGSNKSRSALSDINVTPLVDVMLVLLIMFMVTAPLMQQGIEVELPKTAQTGVEMNEEPFVLIIDKKGVISAGTAKIAMAGLGEKIKAIFATRENHQVFIQADKGVNYGIVAEVMAEIKAAGFYEIGLVTLPKDK